MQVVCKKGMTTPGGVVILTVGKSYDVLDTSEDGTIHILNDDTTKYSGIDAEGNAIEKEIRDHWFTIEDQEIHFD